VLDTTVDPVVLVVVVLVVVPELVVVVVVVVVVVPLLVVVLVTVVAVVAASAGAAVRAAAVAPASVADRMPAGHLPPRGDRCLDLVLISSPWSPPRESSDGTGVGTSSKGSAQSVLCEGKRRSWDPPPEQIRRVFRRPAVPVPGCLNCATVAPMRGRPGPALMIRGHR
jgi:hypothetical protein